MNRNELLDLPVSVTSWILLRNHASEYADLAVYQKLVSEYQAVCPLREMERIMTAAESMFEEDDFRTILEAMFNAYHAERRTLRRQRCVEEKE